MQFCGLICIKNLVIHRSRNSAMKLFCLVGKAGDQVGTGCNRKVQQGKQIDKKN